MGFEDGEKVEWAMNAVLRGVKEPWAPSVYQVRLLSKLLLIYSSFFLDSRLIHPPSPSSKRGKRASSLSDFTNPNNRRINTSRTSQVDRKAMDRDSSGGRFRRIGRMGSQRDQRS